MFGGRRLANTAKEREAVIMDDFSSIIEVFEDLGKGNASLGVAIAIVGILICVMGVIALVVSIVLGVKYYKYNRRENSAHLTGEETARRILDQNGLQNIKVKSVGSMLFGNSYSHYFKKVRLRRRTKGKTSVAALAMGAQKSALAVLDKEGDPDMRKRVRLSPFITLGPLAFIPLIVIGVVVDIFLLNSQGWFLIALICIAMLFYLFSLILSILTLKTEKKAQQRAYELLRTGGMATEQEIEDLKKLFKLYNIQYINDIIISALELLYYVLQIVAAAQGGSSSSSSNN